jgi:hypothetical protein
MVWDIERKLADDVVRPVIYHDVAAACWHPYVKNVTIMVNSIYNGWRWEGCLAGQIRGGLGSMATVPYVAATNISTRRKNEGR